MSTLVVVKKMGLQRLLVILFLQMAQLQYVLKTKHTTTSFLNIKIPI